MVLNGLSKHSNGVFELRRWAKENWIVLETWLPSNLLRQLIRLLFVNASTLEILDDLRQFFHSRNTAAFKQCLCQEIEKAVIRTGWIQREREGTLSWLRTAGYT